MATNALGPGTVNLGVNLPRAMRKDLEKLAKQSRKKLSAYVRDVLADAIREKIVYGQVRSSSAVSPIDAVVLAETARRGHAPTADSEIQVAGVPRLSREKRRANSA